MAKRLQEAKEAERAEKAERDKEAERRLKAGSYSAENELQALNLINEARGKLREAMYLSTGNHATPVRP
jgi:hypothetical protein